MSLKQIGEKSKSWWLGQMVGWGLAIGAVLLIIINGIVWRRANNDYSGGGIDINSQDLLAIDDFLRPTGAEEGNWEVAASKNGKKYYFKGCTGLKRIKKENLITFKSEAEAQKVGLELAKNCNK